MSTATINTHKGPGPAGSVSGQEPCHSISYMAISDSAKILNLKNKIQSICIGSNMEVMLYVNYPTKQYI